MGAPETAPPITIAEDELLSHPVVIETGKSQPVVVQRRPTNPKWSKDKARVGDEVELSADASGDPDGTQAAFTIFEHDADGKHDKVVDLAGRVQGGKAKVKWKYVYTQDRDDVRGPSDRGKPYTLPEYFFVVEVNGVKSARSPILKFNTSLKFQVRYPGGEPVTDEWRFILRHKASRFVIEGKLDKQGFVKVDDCPPGGWFLEVPGRLPRIEVK